VTTVVEEPPVEEAAVVITEPGVYDLDEADYHRDPVPSRSLSSTGARRILPPSCPALFRHDQLHGQPPKAVFDFGHAAHGLVLGTGSPLHVVAADDWRTKAAQEARKEAYAAGHVPVLTHEHQQVVAMADAIRQHPVASALFNPERGKPEQSLFAVDKWHGVMRRARLDWLPDVHDGRLIIPDYKTSISAEPRSIAKSVANYGYHQQAAWYLDLARDLELADDAAAFVLVFQEKTAPYLITVVQPDAEALRVGRERNERALAIYAECAAADIWPGYSDDVEVVSLPTWALYDHDREYA
jgi:hypothetical protein